MQENGEDTFDSLCRSAEQGDADAQYKLAEIYYDQWFDAPLTGYYDERESIDLSIRWHIKSAKQGNIGSIIRLREIPHALNDCSAVVICMLGKLYYYGYEGQTNRAREIELEEAVELFKEAASHGDVESMFLLGEMYYHGHGIPENREQAVNWYKKAAENGRTDAQYLLSKMYYYGKGVQVDYKEALKWCQMAAEQDDAYAQHLLGTMYYWGHGVPENKNLTRKWYSKAADGYYLMAEKGDSNALEKLRELARLNWAHAQYNLGRLYESGRGVRRNRLFALAWYRRAARVGHEQAQAAVRRLNQ